MASFARNSRPGGMSRDTMSYSGTTENPRKIWGLEAFANLEMVIAITASDKTRERRATMACYTDMVHCRDGQTK